MDLSPLIQRAKTERNPQIILEQLPYAELLGVQMEELSDERLLFTLPFKPDNIGNDRLPALHGGVIAGFMETAAILHLMWTREASDIPATVDFNVDYLRPGQATLLFAECQITKQGKRIANVQMNAWQEDREKPVAVARAHFQLG